MTETITDRLRAGLNARGIKYTCGYEFRDGRRVDEGTVTTAWPDDMDAQHSVTFEEDKDGALWVANDVSVREALAMVIEACRDYKEEE